MLPFTSIAMDFIVKLPISEGYDSILTITDTFSKACIFIPCNETIDAAGTTLLYATYVLPHYGLPSRIISDRDPHFMATIIQELCCILSIQHNASTAYQPQTDGQSERSNQKLEQYTCIFTDFHQTNWCRLLPLAQFAFNARPNATTKKAPFELIMGHIPRVHQAFRITTSPPLNNRLALITQARKDAADALHKSQALKLPSNFVPFCVGDRVWLEGKNLNTTHPSAKLAPRRYGPFLVTSVVSRTSF
jgi:transposase InsO family protein